MTKRLNEILLASCLALAPFASYDGARASEYNLSRPTRPISPLHPANPASPLYPRSKLSKETAESGRCSVGYLIGAAALVLASLGAGVLLSKAESAYYKYKFRRENEKDIEEKK